MAKKLTTAQSKVLVLLQNGWKLCPPNGNYGTWYLTSPFDEPMQRGQLPMRRIERVSMATLGALKNAGLVTADGFLAATNTGAKL